MTPFDLAWHPRPSSVPDGSCFPFLFIELLIQIGPNSKVWEKRVGEASEIVWNVIL